MVTYFNCTLYRPEYCLRVKQYEQNESHRNPMLRLQTNKCLVWIRSIGVAEFHHFSALLPPVMYMVSKSSEATIR